jgi:hypothetical protein
MSTKTYPMTIDPSILELLGPSLYTNIYYVLAELIANAYDAQAKNVYIIAEKDSITVEDDGTGMTYEEVRGHYLAVARESRRTEAETYSRDGDRRRMGRKGIGKLAALSVSENVLVQTRSGNDVSGFVLSRHVNEDKLLNPIPEEEIAFKKINADGTSVVMINPEYRLHKTLSVVKKNIAKLFPAVGPGFVIHIIRGDQEEILDSFDTQILSELCSIITLGNEFKKYGDKVLEGDIRRNELVSQREIWNEPIVLKKKSDGEGEYLLEIRGWIGAYKTTRGRKTEFTDFPDNHISLYANSKLGQFDILPLVGQNRLNEVYVVGQLHIDLFEETELPDMALSNRQGYKSDDKRYLRVVEYVRSELLPDILLMRDKWSDYQNEERKQKKLAEQAAKEAELKERCRRYRESVGRDAAQAAETRISQGKQITKEDVAQIVNDALNNHNPDLGLKATVDGLKKKLLISHTGADADFATIAYKMLQYNGLSKEDIIYTSSEDQEARIPRRVSIFDYLRRFFVESASTEMVYVIFITSEKMSTSWAVLSEIGAAWITRKDHQIFNIEPFKPKEPLNVRVEWQGSWRDSDNDGALYTTTRNADVYCQFIEGIVSDLGGSPKGRVANMKYLGTLLEIRE